MSDRPILRRLIDLPGVADLELRALMKREFAEPEVESPDLDDCSRALFGLTAAEARATPRPPGWDGVETQPLPRQVFAFEDAGWDVTDDRRRPLRILQHFNQQLWLAIRGVAGELPFQAQEDSSERMMANLAAEAARFKKR